ncbi:anti-sigma factor domain-containing protein [Psychromicrobium sp. YIM B11713]|uniref:anti-sigma factor n=1 Tax=Psychromicrobium sp. YIM B11713 TaxID=3145233 RepID=UPI00374E878F
MNEDFSEDIRGDLAQGRVLELAELVALDAVDDQERAQIEEYLRAAPEPVQRDFSARVRDIRETIAEAYATVEEEPPAGLWEAIQSKISVQTEQSAQPTQALGSEELAVVPGDELSARRQQRQAQRSESSGSERSASSRSRARTVRGWLMGAVAAAAIVVAGSFGVNSFIQSQDPVNQVITASDVQNKVVPVQGGGEATIKLSSSQQAAVLQMSEVPAPQAGKTYQLWLVPTNGGDPASLGLMSSAADLGKPTLVKNLKNGEALAITVEPSGGSDKPSSAPVMVSAINL